MHSTSVCLIFVLALISEACGACADPFPTRQIQGGLVKWCRVVGSSRRWVSRNTLKSHLAVPWVADNRRRASGVALILSSRLEKLVPLAWSWRKTAREDPAPEPRVPGHGTGRSWSKTAREDPAPEPRVLTGGGLGGAPVRNSVR